MQRPDGRLDHDQALVAGTGTLARVALTACALAGLLGASAAQAGRQVVPLPWPPDVLPRTPPLAPSSSAAALPPLSTRFIGRLPVRERIVVGIDGTGTPRSVRVLQRILVSALGDYAFAVPAPVRSVTPGPGTQSAPGQRENQILWQGFSPGRRVLAAWADLRAEESAGSLPLRIRVETKVDGEPLAAGERKSGDLEVTLTATNVTGAVARSFTAEADPLSLAQVLDRLRDAVRRDVFAEGLNVTLRGPQRPVSERIAVPLRIEGTLWFPPGRVRITGAEAGVVRVSRLLDGNRRKRLRVEVRGQAELASIPKVELRVEPVGLGSLVDPTGGGAWIHALRDGRLRGGTRGLLARAIALELRYARERQFEMFLAGPDATSPSSATYVYRTAAAPRAVAAPAEDGNGGADVAALILVGLGLTLAGAVGAVVWAHA